MILTIASGKGGTGKTTVSTNLAASLDVPVQLLDCDVEEPNSHLFLNNEQEHKEDVYTMIPAVNQDLCTLCGECEKICSFSAISLIGEKVMTFPEMCHSCLGCTMACPSGALTESSRLLGEIITCRSGNIELLYGRLRIGEAMSPPLIEKVKEKRKPHSLTLIDAPPGTSCPVIAALRDSDAVILVTEPTPFGLNDLVLAVEAVRILGIPFGLVINRCDSGTDMTIKYAEKEGIPILLEIPDSRKIAEAYSKGKMMVEVMPEMKQEFRNLYQKASELAAVHAG